MNTTNQPTAEEAEVVAAEAEVVRAATAYAEVVAAEVVAADAEEVRAVAREES